MDNKLFFQRRKQGICTECCSSHRVHYSGRCYDCHHSSKKYEREVGSGFGVFRKRVDLGKAGEKTIDVPFSGFSNDPMEMARRKLNNRKEDESSFKGNVYILIICGIVGFVSGGIVGLFGWVTSCFLVMVLYEATENIKQ